MVDMISIILLQAFVAIANGMVTNETPIVKSRVNEGRSSRISFPAAIADHKLTLQRARAGQHRMAVDETVELAAEQVLQNTNEFFDMYGPDIGVKTDEMKASRVFMDPGSGVSYHHYDQIVNGYVVYGGDIVVTIGSNNEVLGSQGHPLPSNGNYTIKPSVVDNALDLKGIIANYFGSEKSKSIKPESIDCEKWDSELLWYRTGLKNGRTGDVFLVHRVDAVCNIEHEPAVFEIYVNAETGGITEFIDKMRVQRKRGGKGRRRPISSTSAVSSLETSGHYASSHRELLYYSDLDLRVVQYGTSTVLFDSSYDEIPSSPSDLEPALEHSVAITRMMRAISNQDFLSFKKIYTTLQIQILYPEFNAYYDGTKIVMGTGLSVPDVIAHEWAHGYTDHTSNLIYSYESGAMNEGFSDVFGEIYDILQKGGPPLRSAAQTCTSDNWAYKQLPSGSDNTRRWVIGDDITHSNCGSLCAIRDMYYPECFGHPSAITSSKYYCGSGDNGGVHYNSGVLNRFYSLLVDGGVQGSITVSAIGMVKATNLMWKMELRLTSGSTFEDFATGILDECSIQIGADLYELDYISGTSTVSSESLNDIDCAKVDVAVQATAMMTPPCEAVPDSVSIETSSDIGSMPVTFEYEATMTGAFSDCADFVLSGDLNSISITMVFDGEGATWASDIALGLTDSTGTGVAIGGYDVFLGLQTQLSWPAGWDTATDGTYTASGSLSSANMGGYTNEEFSVCFLNGWTGSDGVSISGHFSVSGAAETSATAFPTSAPSTLEPTRPTLQPTARPTSEPSTGNPTLEPTTATPTTAVPSVFPTADPTEHPSTTEPSAAPTLVPPTAHPTSEPTRAPTNCPTVNPTEAPLDCSTYPPTGSDVYDDVSQVFLSAGVKWMEVGSMQVFRGQWSGVETSYTSFNDPVVFLSLPELIGTASEGSPVSLRVRNAGLTSVAQSSFEFEARSYAVNDSFCSGADTYYTPEELALPAVTVSYAVMERGFFVISGHGFSVGKDVITRSSSNAGDSANQIKSFNLGCKGVATKKCGWNQEMNNNNLVSIAQLQTTRVDRFLLLRCYGVLRKAVVYGLVPHDSTSEANYVIPLPGEDYAFLAFERNMNIGCKEDIVIESYKGYASHTAVSLSYVNAFTVAPAVFGMLNSFIGTQSSGVRASEISGTTASVLIQEDKCVSDSVGHMSEKIGILVLGSIFNGPLGCTHCGVAKASASFDGGAVAFQHRQLLLDSLVAEPNVVGDYFDMTTAFIVCFMLVGALLFVKFFFVCCDYPRLNASADPCKQPKGRTVYSTELNVI